MKGKKITAILMAVLMVVTMLPVQALAKNDIALDDEEIAEAETISLTEDAVSEEPLDENTIAADYNSIALMSDGNDALTPDGDSDYTLILYYNVGTKQKSVVVGDDGYILPDISVERDGYINTGWRTSQVYVENGVNYAKGQKITKDDFSGSGNILTLIALWKTIDEDKYAVKFDPNSIYYGCMDAVEVTKNSEYEIPACGFTHPNLVLDGWATAADGEAAYAPGDKLTITQNTTFYPVWRKVRVCFDRNGGGGSMDPVSYEKGTEYTIPDCDFKREGYFFAGWSIDKNGEAVYFPGEQIALAEDITLYAFWSGEDVSFLDLIGCFDGGYLDFGGIRWRVIGQKADETEALLISADVLGGTMNWATAKQYCNDLFNSTAAFSSKEKSVIKSVFRNDRVYKKYRRMDLNGGNLFLLSGYEADKYFFINNEDRKPGNWWLRSPHGLDGSNAGVVDGYGLLSYDTVDLGDRNGARPAFVLNLSSVLFTSAAEGGKSSTAAGSGFGDFSDGGTEAKKLTLLDNSRSGFAANIGGSGSAAVASGGTVAINYSGAGTGTGEYVSAMLCNSAGDVIGYASVASDSDGADTWSLTLPSDLTEGATYTLKVFSEQQNGDNTTDYASPMIPITLTVGDAPAPEKVAIPTFSPAGGTYTEAQSVTISCATSGADIFYTTGENAPTSGSTKYSGAISVASTTSIKAIAIKNGMTDSDVAAATYTIQTQDPTPPDPPQHEHSYASAVTAKPTCTQKGVRTYKCECGDSYTEEIKALGHEYKSEITKEPSVTEQGVRKFTCLRCGDSYVETIEKLDGAFLLYEKEGGTNKICASKKLNSGRSFTLIPIFESGKVVNARVVWSSSNPDIATVTQSGKVTALGSGETKITVQSEENAALKAYCYVSVAEPVTEVSLDKKNYSFGTGESVKLNAAVLPFTAKQHLKWTADNENVSIAVSKDTLSAIVTGKTAGKAKVTATATDGSGKKATCSFTIGTAVPDFTIAGKNNVSAVEAGKTLNMTVNWGTSKPSNSGVTWELTGSNANYIASITDKGVLTGITAGKVTVNAISKANPNKTASAEITVSKPAESKKAKVTGITFTNKDNLVSKGLNAGKSYTIKTKLTLDGKGSADSHAVAWVTSDPTVATVNQRGTVKAVAPGTVTVTAITRDASDINTAPKATVEFRVYSMIKGVKLDKKKLTIGTQAGTQYGKVSIASVSPANASDPSIAWAVNSNGVALAAIPEDGYPADGEFASAGTGITTKSGEAVAVRASTPGVVKLTGITKDGSKKKVTCTITVRGEVTGLTLKTQAAKNGVNDVTQGTVSGNKVTYKSTMKESGSLKLTPVFEINGVANAQSTKKTYNAYRKYTDLSVSYRSSDTTVATVDKNGKIKIQKKAASGKTATIYGVTADGQRSVEVFVTVK